VVSLSLGITNLLPIPALDGGKFVLLILEAIRRKPLKQETEVALQLLGFSFVIVLSLYVTFNDISKIL
jgi:regulator of sigma E protease